MTADLETKCPARVGNRPGLATSSSFTSAWAKAPSRTRTDLERQLAAERELNQDATVVRSARRPTKTPIPPTRLRQRESV